MKRGAVALRGFFRLFKGEDKWKNVVSVARTT